MWFVSKQTADFERHRNNPEATKKSITLTYKKTLSCWWFKRGLIAFPTSSSTVIKADLTASLSLAGEDSLIVTLLYLIMDCGRLSYLRVHV